MRDGWRSEQPPDGAQPLAVLAANERCSEIVWSPDGERVGFVINGQQLRLYEAATHKPAGRSIW